MHGIYMSVRNDSDGFQLPVNPEIVGVVTAGDGERFKIAKTGAVNVPKSIELSEFGLESFFPGQDYHFLETRFRQPSYYINKLNQWHKERLPVRYIYVNGSFTINTLVTIENFEIGETFGSSDVNFNLSLLKYVSFEPKKMKVAVPKRPPTPKNPKPKPKVVKKKAPARQNKKPKQKTYTLVAGDSLWKVAQKSVKNGARYPEVQKLNNIKNSELRRLPIGLKLKLPSGW